MVGEYLMGGALKQGMGVLIGARATIFVTGEKFRKTAKKEQQQTSKKKRKQRQNGAAKGNIIGALPTRSAKTKVAQQKAEGTPETSRINTSKKHGQHITKNRNILLSFKKIKNKEEKPEQKQNTKELHIKCLNNRYGGGKGEKTGATPTETTTQKHSKKRARKNAARKTQ